MEKIYKDTDIQTLIPGQTYVHMMRMVDAVKCPICGNIFLKNHKRRTGTRGTTCKSFVIRPMNASYCGKNCAKLGQIKHQKENSYKRWLERKVI